MKLAAFDLALPPTERLGALVVSSEEGFDGLAQLIFGFEASAVECPALQQTEYDFNLVQPTGGSRREMKPDSPLELRQPVVVSFVGGVIIKDDVDLRVLRLIGQHAIQEATKVFPLLKLRELRLNLASADFEGGKQIQRPWRL